MRRRLLFVLLAASGCGLDLVGAASAPDVTGGTAAATRDARADQSANSDSGVGRESGAGGPGCDACPDGTPHRVCVQNACVDTYRVFLTSAGFAANFGGSAGADKKCQDAASGAHLNGTWMAWLASAGSGPKDRFTTKSTIPYRLLDGTAIAASFAAIVPGTEEARLDHAIDVDEKKTRHTTGELEVWTGLAATGDAASDDCNGWTTKVPSTTGTVGIYTSTTGTFSFVYQQNCDRNTQHLYCFEQ